MRAVDTRKMIRPIFTSFPDVAHQLVLILHPETKLSPSSIKLEIPIYAYSEMEA